MICSTLKVWLLVSPVERTGHVVLILTQAGRDCLPSSLTVLAEPMIVSEAQCLELAQYPLRTTI